MSKTGIECFAFILLALVIALGILVTGKSDKPEE
jgi:hypothetical protein